MLQKHSEIQTLSTAEDISADLPFPNPATPSPFPQITIAVKFRIPPPCMRTSTSVTNFCTIYYKIHIFPPLPEVVKMYKSLVLINRRPNLITTVLLNSNLKCTPASYCNLTLDKGSKYLCHFAGPIHINNLHGEPLQCIKR